MDKAPVSLTGPELQELTSLTEEHYYEVMVRTRPSSISSFNALAVGNSLLAARRARLNDESAEQDQPH